MKCLAVIPARGGSKGLAGKNILDLNGKPLIAYSIEAALEAKQVEACYVTTDDDEIVQTARQFGAGIVRRPRTLASDHAPTADAVAHLIETLRNAQTAFDYTHLVLLQPTSPLRNALHVDKAISLYVSSRARCLMSMVEAEHHPYKEFRVEESGRAVPLFGADCLSRPRQKLPKILRQNGAIYIMPIETFMKLRTFYCEPMAPYIMSAGQSVDIDRREDFLYAQIIMGEASNSDCRSLRDRLHEKGYS
ncbi:MAG: acylneuraminate cytidylyltransferase family protein [Hyphomicrobiales bacterium]